MLWALLLSPSRATAGPLSPEAAAGVGPAASLQPAAQAVTGTPAAPGTSQLGSFAIGLGYPDLRARLGLGQGWDLEAKFAVEPGVEVWSGRVYWKVRSLGPLEVLLGGEYGGLRFYGIDSLDGAGDVLEGFLGLEVPFAGRFRFSVDAGPARLRVSSGPVSYVSDELIFNTALYICVFP